MVGDLFQNSTKIFIQLQQINSYSTKNIHSTSTNSFIFNKNIHSTSTKVFVQLQQFFYSRNPVVLFGDSVTVSTWMKISKNSEIVKIIKLVVFVDVLWF
jgi:hypothetical protein